MITTSNDGVFWGKKTDPETNAVKVYIDQTKLLDFCSKKLNYYSYVDLSGNYILVKVSRNSIMEVGKIEGLKQAIKQYLRTEQREERVWSKFVESKYIDANFLHLLEVIDFVDLNPSTKDVAHICYLNGVALVSATGIEMVNYEDYPGYVWKEQIQNRNFIPVADFRNAEFAKFLRNISNNEEQRIKSLVSVLGYLMHPYKDPANAKAVIFLDEKMDLSGQAHGGTGKSLLLKAVGHIVPVAVKDGKRYKSGEQFSLSTIKPFDRILYFDDVNPNFQFSELYSMITGSIEINQKYKAITTIPFSLSPKVAISSNHPVLGTGGETDERRRIEIEISDHYSMAHTPAMEFGHNLFDDWDEEQWAPFDNLMVSCITFFIVNGIIQPIPINLPEHKLIASTNTEIVAFLDDNILSGVETRFDKTTLREGFLAAHPAHKLSSSIAFKKWLDCWAAARGYNITHGTSNSRQFVIFNKKEEADV